MEESVILMKKYRLLEKIGSGSFGSIYACTPNIKLGQHVDTHERYAVKLVRNSRVRKRKVKGMDNYNMKLSCINYFMG